MKRLFLIFLTILAGVFSFNCLAIEAGIYQGGALSPDKRIIESRDKKIISPSRVWTWWNSWHIIKRQPPFYGRKIYPPYTLINSFFPQQAEELTWAHFSFAVWQKPIREFGDCNISEIEKWIWKNRDHSARIVRIDKLAKNFYVVAYVRQGHTKFNIREVSGYPPFNISPQVNDEAIFFNIQIKDVDPFKRGIGLQPMKFSVKNIFLLNPAFFLQPTELEDVVISYNFFADKFIHQHKKIKEFATTRGDPMMIKITKTGIVVRFRKETAASEL
ncbi:MAG: hypothetical protein U9O66_02645 [Patescibacteria group bacterium]|nr:hypothetical protein [Patescibacteria group bacterium]